jgi:hypothetical protein
VIAQQSDRDVVANFNVNLRQVLLRIREGTGPRSISSLWQYGFLHLEVWSPRPAPACAVGTTQVNHLWKTIFRSANFSESVVIFGAPSVGGEPISVRTACTEHSFELRIHEWDLPGRNSLVETQFLVVEQGVTSWLMEI